MPSDFDLYGVNQLERLGSNFKQSGNRELKKKLLAGIRKTNQPTIKSIRASAGDTLPQRGGLADEVARSKFGTRTRLTGQKVGVEIRGTGRNVRSLRQMNEGKLRKPLFGNRKNWYEQNVEPGFFDEPIKKDLPRIRAGIKKAMDDTAKEITKGL